MSSSLVELFYIRNFSARQCSIRVADGPASVVWKASDVPVGVATEQQRRVLSNNGLSAARRPAGKSIARKATLGRRCVTEALHRRGSQPPGCALRQACKERRGRKLSAAAVSAARADRCRNARPSWRYWVQS